MDNNITKWLKSITSDKFNDFVYLRDCSLCPAKSFCDKDDDDGVPCEEKFYQWALMEE
jgi:hypothetical protein